MQTEYEIVFHPIDKDEIRKILRNLNGICKMKNTLMKRVVFANPINDKISYVRVRDEGEKITCTYKEISDKKLDINSVKELETEVKDYDSMINIFRKLGLRQKAEQESYREIWEINNEIEIMIDEWPGVKPFIEIEGKNEEIVRKYSEKLGFSWEDGIFGAVDQVYKKELGIPEDIINNLEIITFEKPPKI